MEKSVLPVIPATIPKEILEDVPEDVRWILEKATPILRAHGETRRGGFFVIMKPGAPSTFGVGEKIGPVLPARLVMYRELSYEQASRLLRHPEHRTSYESRDPGAEIPIHGGKESRWWGMWGGAIRAGEYVLSFNGLGELLNEALVFALAVRRGWLEKDEVLSVISNERNPHLRELLIDLPAWKQ